MDPIQQVSYKGFIIAISNDEFAQNPRTSQTNLGLLEILNNRHFSGDASITLEGIEEKLEAEDLLAFPVYAYIHGAILLSLAPFNCRFDSALAGIITCSKERAQEVFPELEGEALKKAVKESFECCEIGEYQSFINGEAYEFAISKDGEEVDTCSGFSILDMCVEAAKEKVDEMALPEDYEQCHLCGYDHEYEPEEAHRWHRENYVGREEV